MPEEPSVLDYLKSKLRFWERGVKIEIPAQPEMAEPDSGKVSRAGGMDPVLPEPEQGLLASPTPMTSAQPNLWPWRSLLALLLALLGQRAWEPAPDRTAGVGLVLYTFRPRPADMGVFPPGMGSRTCFERQFQVGTNSNAAAATHIGDSDGVGGLLFS